MPNNENQLQRRRRQHHRTGGLRSGRNLLSSSVEAEKKIERRETRRHTSLEGFTYEKKEFFDDGTDLLADLMSSEMVSQVMSQLTEHQQYLIQKCCLEGWTYTDLAVLEGKDESAIRHAVNRAKSKLKKFLS